MTPRSVPSCVLLGISAGLSGCLFTASSLDQQLQQATVQAGALETRVAQLERAQGVNTSAAAAPTSSSNTGGGELVFSDASGVGASGRGSAGGAGRWPGWPIEGRKAMDKLTRGLLNILTGWVEIPKRSVESTRASGLGVGVTWGLLRGAGYGFVRTVGGVYDVITFPVPVPSGYRPLMRPAYVFTSDEP